MRNYQCKFSKRRIRKLQKHLQIHSKTAEKTCNVQTACYVNTEKTGFCNVGSILIVRAAAAAIKGFLQGGSQMQYKSRKVRVQQTTIYIQC